jgi:hypothetical protein
VKDRVYRGRRWLCSIGPAGVRRRPVLAKSKEIMPPAFHAGPVTGRKRGRFVEKEQLCIVPRLHQRQPAPSELERTGNPAPALVAPDDLPAAVNQAASISHQRSTRWCFDQFAERCDSVSQWHGVFFCQFYW